MEVAIIPYCHVASDGGTKAFWQAAWEGQAIHGASFLPFSVGTITNASTGDLASLTLTLPELPDVMTVYHASVALSWIWEVRLMSYTVTSGNPYPTGGLADTAADWATSPTSWGGMTTRAAFSGEVTGGQLTGHTLSVTLGSKISKLNAPPLKFTNVLSGQPGRL